MGKLLIVLTGAGGFLLSLLVLAWLFGARVDLKINWELAEGRERKRIF